MFHRKVFAKRLMMIFSWAVVFGRSLLSLDFYVFEILIMSMYHFYYLKIIKLFLFWKKNISSIFLYLPGSLLSCAFGFHWHLVITFLFHCPLLFVFQAEWLKLPRRFSGIPWVTSFQRAYREAIQETKPDKLKYKNRE